MWTEEFGSAARQGVGVSAHDDILQELSKVTGCVGVGSGCVHCHGRRERVTATVRFEPLSDRLHRFFAAHVAKLLGSLAPELSSGATGAGVGAEWVECLV